MMVDYLEAISKLGVPLALLTWWIYSWMYRNDRLDRNADRKQTEEDVKALRKAGKEAKKQRKAEQKAQAGKSAENTSKGLTTLPEEDDFWMQKWMWMGGGFYGLAALWTLLVVEVIDFLKFLPNISEFIVQLFSAPIDLAVSVFINQMQNLGTAFVWVTYWDNGFSLIWFGIAYVAYLLGIQLAKRYDARDVLKSVMSTLRRGVGSKMR